MAAIKRSDVRAAMRKAIHERWCGGPGPRTCGNACNGNPDPEELDAATDAVMALLNGSLDPNS